MNTSFQLNDICVQFKKMIVIIKINGRIMSTDFNVDRQDPESQIYGRGKYP